MGAMQLSLLDGSEAANENPKKLRGLLARFMEGLSQNVLFLADDRADRFSTRESKTFFAGDGLRAKKIETSRKDFHSRIGILPITAFIAL